MHCRGVRPPVELDARDDVAPLVRSTHLQGAPVLTTQLHVVVGLEQHVAEFGVRDAVALEPASDGVAREHDVDGEVLADIAEEVDDAEGGGPVGVVHDDRAGRGIVEVDEPLELPTDAFGPLGDRVRRVHGPLPHLARVADHAGGAAGQHDRPVARPLKALECEQRHEVTRVQTGAGRVESGIERDRARVEVAAECVEVGRLGDQPAPGQFVEDVLSHCSIIPSGAERPARAGCAGRPTRPPPPESTAATAARPRR